MEALGKLAVGLMAFMFMAVFGGFTIMTIWNWFMPEIFGLTSLTIVQALGLSCVNSIFNLPKIKDAENEKNKTFLENALTGVVFYSVLYVYILIYGYLIHTIM